MTAETLRTARTTPGTGHPRLHPIHEGHLFAGQDPAGVVRLRATRTVFGSDPSCDVVVPALAPRHFEVARDEDDRYVVRPLQGDVQVGGRRGPALTVHTGDLIRCSGWAASFARDASTDQVRERAERYLSHHGFFGHLEHVAFLLYGLSTLPRGQGSRHRAHPERQGAAAGRS